MGKNEKNLKLEKKISFGKKLFGLDTDIEIGPWLRFPIRKPGFSCSLLKLTTFLINIYVH